jgi:hypothetical protein
MSRPNHVARSRSGARVTASGCASGSCAPALVDLTANESVGAASRSITGILRSSHLHDLGRRARLAAERSFSCKRDVCLGRAIVGLIPSSVAAAVASLRS